VRVKAYRPHMISTEVRLRSRTADLTAFEFTRSEVPDPAPGQVVVRNLYMSLDPGMLRRITEPGLGYAVGHPLTGEAIGEVVATADPAYTAGDLVAHPYGWREHAVAPAAALRRIDPDAYPTLSTHLNFGLVAYVGLLDIAALRPGDTVFVSSAAGAVGALAGQFARLAGAKRVIGSAGSPDKVRHLTEHLGFDAAFNYHDEELAEDIDVYFDNVGGTQLGAAIERLNPGGRVVLCGTLADDPATIDPRTLLARHLSVRGFTVMDHLHRAPDFSRDFRTWLADGLVYDETVVEGLHNAPEALLDLRAGKYLGKVVVRIAERKEPDADR
jgi:NADPH-dependent curcumin reductase CurA